MNFPSAHTVPEELELYSFDSVCGPLFFQIVCLTSKNMNHQMPHSRTKTRDKAHKAPALEVLCDKDEYLAAQNMGSCKCHVFIRRSSYAVDGRTPATRKITLDIT